MCHSCILTGVAALVSKITEIFLVVTESVECVTVCPVLGHVALSSTQTLPPPAARLNWRKSRSVRVRSRPCTPARHSSLLPALSAGAGCNQLPGAVCYWVPLPVSRHQQFLMISMAAPVSRGDACRRPAAFTITTLTGSKGESLLTSPDWAERWYPVTLTFTHSLPPPPCNQNISDSINRSKSYQGWN